MHECHMTALANVLEEEYGYASQAKQVLKKRMRPPSIHPHANVDLQGGLRKLNQGQIPP